MRTAVKRMLATVTPPSNGGGCRVLLYHAIGEPSPEDRLGLRVTRAAFRKQMEWLKEEGFSVVPLTTSGTGAGAAWTVAITFDDGYASQLEAAAILEEFGFPATFFVVPAFLDASTRSGGPHSAFRPAGRWPAGLHGRTGRSGYWDRWGYFGWSQLKELAARGFEIGAHSASHTRLTRC